MPNKRKFTLVEGVYEIEYYDPEPESLEPFEPAFGGDIPADDLFDDGIDFALDEEWKLTDWVDYLKGMGAEVVSVTKVG